MSDAITAYGGFVRQNGTQAEIHVPNRGDPRTLRREAPATVYAGYELPVSDGTIHLTLRTPMWRGWQIMSWMRL